MPYAYDELGLTNQIEDYICQLKERFGWNDAKVLELVTETLENFEEFV